MELANDTDMQPQEGAEYPVGAAPVDKPETPESDRKLVDKIIRTIREDKTHHKGAFKQMKRDMQVAAHGHTKDWATTKYVANVTGRHIRQRTASLYAKNPKATAKRREMLDFAIWDENAQTLAAALQLVQQASQIPSTVTTDPYTGQSTEVAPELPGLEEAQALIQDATRGLQRRAILQKFGRSMELLFAHALREQNPVEFKVAAKQAVRRACTTGVGYVEIGFQREYGPRPESVNKLADDKVRLEHLQNLLGQASEGEITDADAEMSELEAAIAAEQAQPEALLREGLVFDFPVSTKVIPDRMCKSLVGFQGAAHIAIEYHYSPDQVKETFGVDLDGKFTSYTVDGTRGDGYSSANFVDDDEGEQIELPLGSEAEKKKGLVCVWKYYDKPSGLVYYVADGYDGFLRPPGPPDIKVDDFWPIRALTFNEVENEDELFPPSDVSLILGMQEEINRSREGLREHRKAARPRWGYPNGAIDEGDLSRIAQCKEFDAIGLNIEPNTDLAKVLQPLPVPGVDPNLYETGPFFTDLQLVAGTNAPMMGGQSRATATADAIAADSASSADSSGVDDMDAFLTWVARSSGQVLLREMTPEKVQEIVGPGAAWPGLGDLPAADASLIADEVFLEVEAGSSGKPNQAVEIRKWKEMLPFLLQMGSIPPVWLARETLRRLDDRLDLTEAVVAGLPSIVAANRGAQLAPGNAQSDPAAQGENGADKAPAPGGPTGSTAPMGDNHM